MLQLVEAKLRRAYQEGQAARLAGQDPLAAELAALLHKPKPTSTAPVLPTALEDHNHTHADPSPPPQSPPRASMGVSQQSGDARRGDGGLTREEQLSIAQADANMAALLQEEAGSVHFLVLSLGFRVYLSLRPATLCDDCFVWELAWLPTSCADIATGLLCQFIQSDCIVLLLSDRCLLYSRLSSNIKLCGHAA